MKNKIIETFNTIDKSGDWTPLLNMMSDSVELMSTIPEGTPVSGIFKGKASVSHYFYNILPSVATFRQNKPMEFFGSTDKVVIIGDDSYTLAINGKTFRSPYAIVLEFEDTTGIIQRMTIIQDLSGMYESYKLVGQ